MSETSRGVSGEPIRVVRAPVAGPASASAADDFARLVRENAGRLLARAQRLLGDRARAAAAVQAAFAECAASPAEGASDAVTVARLEGAVVRAALAHLRASRDAGRTAAKPVFTDDGHHARPQRAWCIAPGAHSAARHAIGELPAELRVVLVLSDVEGMAAGDIAELLDESLSNVAARLHGARVALRERLDPLLAPEPAR